MLVLVSTSFLCVALLLALKVAFCPAMRADKPGLLALLSFAGAMVTGWGSLWPAFHWAELPLVAAAVALVPAVAIVRGFGRVDPFALLFHRDFGMEGVALGSLKNQIVAAIAAVAVILLATLALAGLWRAEAALPLAVAGLVIGNPILRFALRRMLVPPAPSDLTDRLAAPRLTSAAPLPDLVMIYLEGTDRRFADAAHYGQAYARLHAHAAGGICLTRVGQIAGTGWSLAGMVASQSGVPVVPRCILNQKNAEDVPHFMSEVPFLGDLLDVKGYRSHFVVGGETGFGGLRSMYRTHKIRDLTGIREMQAAHTPDEFDRARVSWFVDDEMVLETARGVHRQLSAGEAPFALIVETIGPHGPKGYLSRRWTKDGTAAETNDIAHVVDRMLAEVDEFLAEVRSAQTARGRPLRVVLLSDHLNHIAHLPRGGPAFAGFNTVILCGDPDRPGITIDRPASMIDVYPTILDWLGWAEGPVAAGLGRSLLSSRPTLVEEMGIPALDAMILGDARLSRKLWGTTGQLAERTATA